jgi:hypothetical protein
LSHNEIEKWKVLRGHTIDIFKAMSSKEHEDAINEKKPE